MLTKIWNKKPFQEVCHGEFGRLKILSSASEINRTNVVAELGKALAKHWLNRQEIDYLDAYYRGVQPILFYNKKVRPEINNKVVENHAYEIVEFKTAQSFAEPVQYVRRGEGDDISESIKRLNDYMLTENKGECDIRLGRWRSICGTAYRYVFINRFSEEFDETPFGIDVLDPRDNFIVYGTQDGSPELFSVSIRKNEKGEQYYVVFTRRYRFHIQNSKIIDEQINGIGHIPIIEYPNNERRLSDIEIVITMLDSINKMQSNRQNGIEQFVQALMKFVNCEIDEDTFKGMINLGAVSIKSSQQGTNADVSLMTAELNQEQSQVAKDDLYDNIISIVGMPSRDQNSAGDTGQAVYLRNGWDFAEQRADLQDPVFRKSENQFLKIIFTILKTKVGINLKLSDIEVKITRSKTDNMSVKANVLTLLLNAGVDYQTAIKTCNLWSDPEETYLKSKERLKQVYEKSEEDTVVGNDSATHNPHNARKPENAGIINEREGRIKQS